MAFILNCRSSLAMCSAKYHSCRYFTEVISINGRTADNLSIAQQAEQGVRLVWSAESFGEQAVSRLLTA